MEVVSKLAKLVVKTNQLTKQGVKRWHGLSIMIYEKDAKRFTCCNKMSSDT